MRNPLLLLLAAGVVLYALPAAAAISYPSGTTLEDAWASPPQISPDAAVHLLVDRFFVERTDDSEPAIDEQEFEAFKYLRGNADQIHEEPSPVVGARDFVSELAPETMTAEQADFFSRLSLSLSQRLGLQTASMAAGVCVREIQLFEVRRVRWRVSGWNNLAIWGIASFARNLQYAVNNSDLVFGIFPFGLEASWWSGIECAVNRPSNEEGLRACGREKTWQLQDASTLVLSPMYLHSVPGVAQASLVYAGAVLTGEAGQFRTNYQTRPATDPTWLLAPSNTPAPSQVTFFATPSLGSNYIYSLSKVVSWNPTVVLNVAYNNPTPSYSEGYLYDGRGGGNPHSLGNFFVHRTFSRFHEAVTVCN